MPFRGQLDPNMAPTWPSLGPPEGQSDPYFTVFFEHFLFRSFTVLRGLMSPHGAQHGPILGPSWPSWAIWVPSWAPLGPTWGHLGPSWGHLGPLLAMLGPSWGHSMLFATYVLCVCRNNVPFVCYCFFSPRSDSNVLFA